MSERFDVAVIGGGPVGAALALELARAAFDVAVIEARAAAQPSVDARPLALSYGSRLILERLGAWRALEPATPIESIHISQRGGFGRTLLTAQAARLPALGYVVDYARLSAALDEALETERISVMRGAQVSAITPQRDHARIAFSVGENVAEYGCALVAVADGGALAAIAPVRTRDYGQSAITARVASEIAHGFTAYERFTPEGPIALLPCGRDYALVWTTEPAHAHALCDMPPQVFLARLHERFGERVGRLVDVGERASYRLALRVAERAALPRTVLLGNAAQALHPVAGQGFNLGLRDAWELAGEIRRRGPDDERVLQTYLARRRVDRAMVIGFTDNLVKLFSNDWLPLKLARGAGLTVLDCIAPAKDFVARRMIFGVRGRRFIALQR